MSKQDQIPFLDLDPSPPKKSVKSLIQRAPEAEDGEIVSSPEPDPADIEIKIHADMTSSEESDDMEETSKQTLEVSERKENANDLDTEDTITEVIQILDTPEKEVKTPQEEFPQKEQPASKKRIVVKHDDDDEVEIDHLEITAPLQQEVKKTKPKVNRDTDKTRSPNGKYSSPEKEKGTRSRSPRDEVNRKRGYDVFDERKSRSDTESDSRNRKTEKQNSEDVEDLRKRLLKKAVSNDKLRDSEKEYQDKKRDHHGRGKDSHQRGRNEKSKSHSKDSKERERDRSGKESQSVETKDYKNKDSSLDKKTNDVPHVKKERKEKESSKSEGSRKKLKSKKSDEKSKKKKKKKDKRKDEERGKDLSPISSPEKTNIDEESKRMELDYDDISSESSYSPLKKENTSSNARSPSPSPVKSPAPIESPSPSPEESVSRTPSRSPTPVRSPTPQRKRGYYPAIEGCRNVEEFTWLNRIEEGTYGVVYRAKDKLTNEIVALKRLKMEKEREGFPITSLREINTLLKAQHPNIVTVREIVVGSNMDKIYIVMDYVEHDLKSLMEIMTQPFLVGEVKTLMLQLLRGVRHMHDNWILHRDIKASNLLLSHQGILKIGDFGLAREYGSPLKKYTSIVVTLWYRAPELLLGAKEYSTPIDLWSVGCVFAELLTMKPLFPGKSEIDQINRIFKELGTPNDKIWPGPPTYSEHPQVKKMNIAEHPYNVLRNRFGTTLTDRGFDLMNKFLTYDPARRITAEEALKHDYFQESPTPVDPSMFPTWPAKSELGHKALKKNASPKAPEGGGEFNLQVDDGGGFHMPTIHKGSAAKGLGFNLKF